ncbi:galactokinase [Haladaptatus sp. R4]|uniref:galactokinase n=1 Tax=Haladaptatus sp. R4 TaxID=1679489 RepID=UPI000AF119C1|nr:galactokinase [Haladaptatus sp. R4]
MNLIGGHTDYNDGFVLPVAIDRRTEIAVRPRTGTRVSTDRTVRAYSTNFDESREFSLDSSPSEGSSWLGYIEGIARELAEGAPGVSGFDLVVDGDVPMGSGLSSSASLELATATALNEAWDLDYTPTELADLGWRVEREFVGVECGIMDQFVVALGERDHALFLDCRTRNYERHSLDGDVRVVVTNTNVEHELVDSAYNERVAQCAEGVELLDEALGEDVSALRDVSVAEFEAVGDELPETIRERCGHVVYENERRSRGRERARNRRDGTRRGTDERIPPGPFRDSYEVSCPELDFVVEVAGDIDAELGSRMTGAGFGGCVVSLVREESVESFAETVREAYLAETGIEPDVFPCASPTAHGSKRDLRIEGVTGSVRPDRPYHRFR